MSEFLDHHDDQPDLSPLLATGRVVRRNSAVHFCALSRKAKEAKIELAIIASPDGSLSL